MAENADTDVFLTLPIMPLREVVMFPRSIMPLFVGREASIKAIEVAQASYSKQIFLVTQREPDQEKPEADDLAPVGVVCKVLQMLRLPDGTIKVLFEGMYRAVWQELHEDGHCALASVRRCRENRSRPEEGPALVRATHEALEEYGKNNKKISQEAVLSILSLQDPGALADAVMPHLKVDYRKKQEVLEADDITVRLELTYELLQGEVALSSVEKRIKNRVKVQMERNQREYYLNEQIKAINKEMGRDDDPQAELEEIEQKIKARDMPDEARAKALGEVRKLRSMSPSAAEYTVVRNYVDWILDLPWNDLKQIDINIEKARNILDGEHFGLEKPKERILEYLAVQKLSQGLKGPILCFVGPPGVGKTSLAKSVAHATGRDFVRLSLGGVRDEAEIRGHRRTYVGALPGKIIQSLKRVKYNNPLFCLDEIDKMTSDYRGDPASALLEVLDPEQNNTFMDHYLDLEYDLSKVFFITTANSLHTIPAALLDRMEVIELNSYLETEKRHIARRFLLPRQIREHGIRENNIRISDKTILEIIRSYTREAGVRNLEREIAALCRKTAIRLVEKNDLEQCVTVSCQNLPAMLGVKKFRHGEREDAPQIGVCTGLAYNQRGGEILLVETSIMSGTGHVVTTGQLGDVMTESAKAALSYVRSRAELLGLDPRFHRKVDIHVHVPSGATPKDGPSAGITLATSITSALLGIPVRNDVAMTGEISLRGRVLPIGGLREKLLAARRSGITKVLVPQDNEKDLKEVPAEVLRGLEIVFVEHVDDVLPQALAARAEEIFSGRASASPLCHSLRAEKHSDDSQPAQ
ncbi:MULTISPECIES: endopeptidase La [unclassified Desulfovibrio]|uniref:endopeptidase La n=1 Tax=unclassified Desulfovibrio TaxID=2593640 RepID=UPI000F5EBA91|nr:MULTISPECIES: endopeptidase La [unclassified Desulfovibrio]RRD70518.1 endopeptidase La [Desulfovibrio sp. OH1209_COT-279]RRD86967.1 endopeptidase La [Desulfovibrio sp. OH1186_COT-070]